MTNYSSSGPQVPFGDGSHVPLEDTLQGDGPLSEIHMQQMAMKDIFLSCDVDNTGLVLVSKLIEFITPFMQQNNTELLELKKALDPYNCNPCVNTETFYKVMSEWTSHIMAEPTERDGSFSSSTQISEWTEDKDSLVQAASKTNFGQYLLKGHAESSIQNLSTSSSCSYEGSTMSAPQYHSQISAVDLNTLQDKIQELGYQNRKLAEELAHVRLQLTSCEEQNEVLHGDVERLSRKLASEQQLNGQLQLKKNDSEEMLETSAAAQKQIGKLEKLLATAEKENVQLKQSIESMEAEKQKLENTVKQLTKRESETKKLLLVLQSDIDSKDHIIASLEEANAQLKSKEVEQQQIVTHYSDVNERLKAEKFKLEHCFRERLLRSSLSNQSPTPTNFLSGHASAESSEHSGAQNKSPSGSSPRAGGYDSSEDDMCWKVHMLDLSSHHESLEQEIVQAETGCQANENDKQLVIKLKTDIEHMDLKNTEYEATIKQLIRDINSLHAQNAKNEKQVNECEEKYKDLLTKFTELEGDNSSKYIKIVDLMEQTEKLQEQLDGSDDDKLAQLSLLKSKISELQHEKGILQEKLQQWEKQKSETLMQHLQSMKDECELLRNRLDVSTRVEQNVTKEFEKICCENCDLRRQLERLLETIRELDAEKSKLTSSIQKLSDEYNNIKVEVEAKRGMEAEISGKLTKLLNENLELKERLASGRVASQPEEVENLKQVLKQHTATIEQLSHSAEEKKRQISMLKKMVNYQNENLKDLKDSKLKNADQLYEQKCANDNLIEENRALLEKLELKEKEMKELQCQLIALDDSNKTIRTELEYIRCDNNRMRDTDKILIEYQSLVEEKKLLISQKEQLSEDNNKLEKSNGDLQKQLLELQQARNDLSATITELNAKLHSAETEISKLAEKLQNSETANDQAISDLMEEISQLEETSKVLHSENDTLLCKFKTLKASYKALTCEKKEWLAEQSNWEQMKEEFKSNLTSAKNEALCLQQRLNEIEEADAASGSSANEDICENCIMLKLEIKELNEHIDQLNSEVVTLEVEDRNNKKGNFEKMQMTIDKLKTKTEETEGLLESEKQRVETLKQTNLKLLDQINDNLKQQKEEKASIFAEKAVTEIKLKETVDELKRAQNEKHELEQEKNYISRNSVNLEKKLRDASRLMEERLELMNKANSQLQEEVTDLRNRRASLERRLTKLQRDGKVKIDLDGKAEVQSKTKDELESVNKENVQLHQEITDLHSQKVVLEKQLDKLQNELKEKMDREGQLKAETKLKEDLVDSINKECVQLQRELQDTHTQKVSLEKKLEKTQNDLQKSEAKNLSIRKMLTDMRASIRDECEDTLQRNVDALLKERDCQVDNLQKQLKDYEEELVDVKLKLNESADSMSMLSEHIHVVSKTLAEKRQELCRSVLALIDNWRTLLEHSDTHIGDVIEALFNNEPTTLAENFTGPLDEEMDKLKYQIRFIIQFLDALAAIEVPAAATNAESEKVPSETTTPPLLSSRFVKKITLKTTTTEIRPIHSDTSVKGTQTEHIRANTEGPVKMNDSHISSTQNSFSQNHGCDGSVVVSSDKRVEHEGFASAALEIASPGLSDSVMDSLGLLEEGDSSEVMAMGMDEKYGVLAAAFMINISTIKDRYQQQQSQQIDIENQFSTESEKLVTTLTTIRDLDRDRHLEKHVSTCLHQVNSIVGMFARTSVLAMQYGALLHEQRLLKCITLMINYTVHLKEIIEKAALQLKFIRSTHLNVNPIGLPILATHNCSIVSSELADQSGLDCSSPSTTSEMDVNDNTNRCLQYKLWQKIIGFFSYKIIVRREWFWLPFIFIVVAMIAIILMNIWDFNCAPCYASYPWKWVSWNDVFAPYIKKTYSNGPPPI